MAVVKMKMGMRLKERLETKRWLEACLSEDTRIYVLEARRKM